MDLPLVSIIIPNYNGGQYIDSTIESVVNQAYPNWELIIVDDCSTDNSTTIINNWIERFGAKITLYKMANNSGGPAAPRNRAIDLSKGEYIAFLDSDDIWHPSKLDIQMNFMLSAGLSFTCTKVSTFTNEENLNYDSYDGSMVESALADSVEISHTQMLIKNRIRSGSTSIVQKDIIENHLIRFNTDKNCVAVEDYLFWLDIMRLNDISCRMITIPLTFYRISESSISRSKLRMAKKIYQLLKSYRVNGRLLGVRRFFYFSTYVFFSVVQLFK